MQERNRANHPALDGTVPTSNSRVSLARRAIPPGGSMQRSRVVLVLAAACLAVASPASAQAPLRDPCTLLTAAEVSAALGITSLPGRPFLGSRVSCYFAADTGIRMGAASVTVMVMTPVAF